MEWLFLYKSRSGAVVARQSHYLKVGSSSLSSATNGVIAQLEERLLCKQKVLGSIPSFSTNLKFEMVVVIENKLIPFKGFKAINLFGVIFVRKGARMTSTDFNHEAIHTAQMKELGYVFFYILYVIEWLYRLCKPGNAYRNISFEREAYENEGDVYYLYLRKHYAQWRK